LALPCTKNCALGVNVLQHPTTSNAMQQPACASYEIRFIMSASKHGKTAGASLHIEAIYFKDYHTSKHRVSTQMLKEFGFYLCDKAFSILFFAKLLYI
jgi:hypothetical protein